MMKKRTIAALVLAACLLTGWAIRHQEASPLGSRPLFRVSPPVLNPEDTKPFFASEFIAPPVKSGMAHVASICELADGKLAAAWYSGSKEAAPDVAVYFAVRGSAETDSWSSPRVIADAASSSRELGRLVRKVGNAVLFLDKNERLWLIYVTMPFGGWSASSLNWKVSTDEGATWSKSKRLTLSPFFNMSELVRNDPIPLTGGGFALPIYHELLRNYPEIVRIYDDSANGGLRFTKTKMSESLGLIQPTVVIQGEHSARAFFRSTRNQKKVASETTKDGGKTWSKPGYIDLPNPNSGLNALALPKGGILLAFNDSSENRENLRLAVSKDGGADWKRIATLEDTPGCEFSYPYMIRDQRGRTHLVYTWRRRCIKHVTFNDAWIEARLKSQN